RIEVCAGCARCQAPGLPNTRFMLPWAHDPNSKLRVALRADAIGPETPSKLLADLDAFLPTAMLFLKKVKGIEVRENGNARRSFGREDQAHSVTLIDSHSRKPDVWHLIDGDFPEE